jgi:nucleoside-diphosphate-sugar epimerase
MDAVAHLAGLSNDALGSCRAASFDINHRATVRLATLCKEAGIERFIYSSSCSVYGKSSADIVDEESPFDPQTDYAVCKMLDERELADMADDSFSPTFLRNATAYGASPRMRFDLVVNDLSALAWTTGRIAMVSDGTPWRPIVHILDICAAFRAAWWRRATPCTGRCSTSAAPTRTTKSARSPPASARCFRTAR